GCAGCPSAVHHDHLGRCRGRPRDRQRPRRDGALPPGKTWGRTWGNPWFPHEPPPSGFGHRMTVPGLLPVHAGLRPPTVNFSLERARRQSLRVVAVNAVGLYSLVRLERGAVEPGVPGQFFMLAAPGSVLPRPMSLCLAPPGELASLLDPIGPGTRALCALEPGDAIHVLGPLGNGFDLGVEQPLLVG